MTRLVLVNPNTNARTTELMRSIAEAAAPAGTRVDGWTAPRGAPLITDAAMLAAAAEAVMDLVPAIERDRPDGVIVSAFGDPGLAALRARLACPVTGIAEAAMAEAATDGRPFAVATTTPELVDSITATAAAYGHAASFRGIVLTAGDMHHVMADPARLAEALAEACRNAIDRLGAEAVVIGGGPLAAAAEALSGRFEVPLIAPIPAAVRLAIRRA